MYKTARLSSGAFVVMLGLLVVAGVVLAAPAGAPDQFVRGPAAAMTFYAAPDRVEANPGDTFTVELRVDHVTETVRGWQVSLRYDPNVVTMTQFTMGDFFGCPQALPTPRVWQSAESEMLFGAVCLVGDSAGKTDGVLATLTLRAQAGAQPGAQSELAFDVAGLWKTKLVKQGGVEIIPLPANLRNGLVSIRAATGGPTLAPASPPASPQAPSATPSVQGPGCLPAVGLGLLTLAAARRQKRC